MNEKPNIFSYVDYRKFLRDYYEYKKETDSNFTYKVFSDIAKINSPNYLKLVMDGERNVTKQLLRGFSKACGFIDEEKEYFIALVNFNQEKELAQKNRYLKKVNELLKTSVQKEVKNEQFDLLSKWYYLVIRTLFTIDNIPPDPRIVAKRLSGLISPKEAEDAIEALIKMGFVEKKEDRYVSINKHVKMEDEILNTAIQNYHHQIIPVGLAHMKISPLEEREFQAATITVPKENIPDVKMRIKTFYNELINFLSPLKGDSKELCQVNIQFFKYRFKGEE